MRRRVFGIETEYGLTAISPSRGIPMGAERAAHQLFEPLLHQGHPLNLFLRNDGRLYLDVGAHPEYTTAECDRLKNLFEQDRAGASILVDLAVQAGEALSEFGSDLYLHLLRDNLDSQGDSYGYHENYLPHRRRDYRQVADALVAFFMTRQILVGNGWISTTATTSRLQFSQHADQMWDAMSSATTRSRPIINARNETLADSGAYRRMRVIVGDTNVAEPTTALEISMTELLIHAIEDGLQIEDLSLADPIRATRETNSDLLGSTPLEPTNRRTTSAVALQREIHGRILARIPVAKLDPVRAYIADLWGRGIGAIASGDQSSIDTELDIAIKRKLLMSYCIRSGASITDPRVARLELSYSDITADDLWERIERTGFMRRLTTVENVHRAQTTAPAATRARLRGRIIVAAEDACAGLSIGWVRVRLDELSTIPLSLQNPLATADLRTDTLVAQINSQFPTILT